MVAPAVAAVGGLLFAGAVQTAGGTPPHHSLYVYDPASDSWSAATDPSVPFGSAPCLVGCTYQDSSGNTVDGLFVLTTGSTGTGTQYGVFSMYDVGTGNWSSLPPVPGWTMALANLAAVGTQLFAFSLIPDTPSIAVFGIASGTWSPAPLAFPSGLPYPTSGPQTAVTCGTWIYWPSAFGLTQQYDPIYNRWYAQPGPPAFGVPQLSASAIGGSVYVLLGGSNGTDCSMSVFETPSGVWARALVEGVDGTPGVADLAAAMGWAFAVAENGILVDVGGCGFSRGPLDSYSAAFQAATVVPLGQVSQAVTAVAVFAQQQADIDGMLSGEFYLDIQNWIVNPGEGVDRITRGDLLAYKSGMAFRFPDRWGDYMSTMTAFVQADTVGPPGGDPMTLESDISLFEMIMQSLQQGGSSQPVDLAVYCDLVQQLVCGPAGIALSATAPASDAATLGYDKASSGVACPTVTTSTASVGCNGSVLDMLGFAVGLRTNAYFDSAITERMLAGRYGWHAWSHHSDGRNRVYWQGNRMLVGGGPGVTGGFNSFVIRLSNGIDVAFATNSFDIGASAPWEIRAIGGALDSGSST